MPRTNLPFTALFDTYRYRIVREIASGGMGTIYEAMQLGANGFAKRVAIKTLLPRYASNKRFIDMFIDEAKLVADLVHENIIQIYHLSQTTEGWHIVMEYVNGLSLHDFILGHSIMPQPLPPKLAVFIASRIARGLAYAHARTSADGEPLHIVHRDVCPNNVLITTEGLPKLGDFGIAKAANTVTPERGLMGKLYYMAPEQARKEAVDFRADIYSLGLVLFELLAMRPARRFADEDCEDVLHLAEDGKLNWDSLPHDIDPELRAILERMLANDPMDRYSSTDEVGYALEYYIYRSGYGPTVVTLEEYLREHFATLLDPRLLAARERKMALLERTMPIPTLPPATTSRKSAAAE
ncbi:MAG: serine/threonine-protein kinase [Lentisphaeria bacterium]|jgi:serine/threonine protein kinase|nr:serine/threonine-protein kinase [Lentisphaeria bacterium]